MKTRFGLAILCIFAIVGCSTAPVERAQEVSASGKAYVTMLNKVGDYALERTIDRTFNELSDAQALVNEGEGQSPAERQEKEEQLRMRERGLRERIQLVCQAKAYYRRLAEYFSTLETLAKGEQSEAVAGNVKSLGAALKNLPAGLRNYAPADIGAATDFASLVAAQSRTVSVAHALERDAAVVANALKLSEKIIVEQTGWVREAEAWDWGKTYASQICHPYIKNKALDLDNKWKEAWVETLRGKCICQQALKGEKCLQKGKACSVCEKEGEVYVSEATIHLENARVASKEMQEAWKKGLAQQHYVQRQALFQSVTEALQKKITTREFTCAYQDEADDGGANK